MIEGLRDITGDFTWNNSGKIIPGLGPEKTIFLANHTIFIRPKSRTGANHLFHYLDWDLIHDFFSGIPDNKWRVMINETGYLDETDNLVDPLFEIVIPIVRLLLRDF